MSDHVQDITSKEQLDLAMTGSHPVVIDFWADWCGPCKLMAPHFEAVADAFADQDVRFYKLDTQHQPQLAAIFNVRSIPTVIFAHEGKVLDHSIGALDAHKLTKRVERLLARARGEKVGIFEKLFG